MSALPSRDSIAGTGASAPSNATGRTGFGAVWDYLNGLFGSTGTAADARTALAVAGTAGATFTGAINEARGTVAMHATTMDLWAQPNVIDGTGAAVTITAIANAPQAGARRTLYPIAGTIITNGATFAVDGATNYTTMAGDKLEFEAITTSTFKVHIVKADGTPVVADTSTYRIRAWCVFDGTVAGTNAPTAGGNVTSVTRNTNGTYTINFATPMSDANYSASITTEHNAGTEAYMGCVDYDTLPTASALKINTIARSSGTPTDTRWVSVQIVR